VIVSVLSDSALAQDVRQHCRYHPEKKNQWATGALLVGQLNPE
jgi:hypothetical protein